MSLPFWKTKKLSEMSVEEWESLCDGCARCCLHKYQTTDTKELFESKYACELLDTKTCKCTDYPNRVKKIRHCNKLTPGMVGHLSWLPETCAYRLLDEGKDLFPWHPLVSKDPESVHKAGISVANKVVATSEKEARVKMSLDLLFVKERFNKVSLRKKI